MAVYYFRNTGSTDWGLASNWSLTDGGGATGAVPTLSDDAYFTANSGNCLLQTSNRVCNNLITTGYNGTITITTIVLTVGGDVTLSATTTITGTGVFSLQKSSGTSNLTNNGATVSVNTFRLNSATTFVLVDNWTVATLNYSNGASILNGNNINVTGNLTLAATTGVGTTQINLTGTGSQTWSGNFILQNNLNINKPSGAFVVSGTVQFGGGKTLTYTTAGSVTVTGSTLTMSGNGTYNTSGMSWNAVVMSGSNPTITLLNDFYTTTFLGVNNTQTFNGYTLYSKSFDFLGTVQGTTTFYINQGGGIWKITGANGNLTNNLTINHSGTTTVSGTVKYRTGTLTVANTVTLTTTGSTLTINGGGTLDTSSVTWNNVTFNATATVTLSSILVVGGTLSLGNVNFATNPVHVQGNFSASTNTGTAGTLIVNGTGNQTWSNASAIRMNLQINKPSGTLFLSGNVGFNTATLTYITGNVDTTGSTLIIAASATLNSSGISWNNIVFQGAVTLTLTSSLLANLINLSGGGNSAFAGSFGFVCNTLTHQTLTASRTYTFGALNNYIVNTNLTFNSTSFAINLTSSSVTLRANLKLTYGGTQNVRNTNATRIDSSGGETIYTSVSSTLTDTINWGKSEGNMLLVL